MWDSAEWIKVKALITNTIKALTAALIRNLKYLKCLCVLSETLDKTAYSHQPREPARLLFTSKSIFFEHMHTYTKVKKKKYLTNFLI